jgi:hypothetical protein
MGLLITSLFYFIFHRLVRVCHKLFFHFNNKKGREGSGFCILDIKLGWFSMDNFISHLVYSVCVIR